MRHRRTSRPRPELTGERVTLRGFRKSDIRERQAYPPDPEIRRMYGFSGNREAGGSLRDWYHKEISHPCSWAIQFQSSLIGAARLNVVPEGGRARFAIGLYRSEFTGQGLGSEAAHLVLQYAFHDLHLHRVDLRVIDYNHRAIRSYEKVGFVEEGRERETVFVDGQWHSDVMMSILEHEYERLDRT